jgi:hypothetical protein
LVAHATTCTPSELEPIYARLLDQFEERRPVELGDSPAPPMPAFRMRRRRSGEEFG